MGQKIISCIKWGILICAIVLITIELITSFFNSIIILGVAALLILLLIEFTAFLYQHIKTKSVKIMNKEQ